MKSNVQLVIIGSALVMANMLTATNTLASYRHLDAADTTVGTSDSTKYPIVDVVAEFPGGMDALVKFLSGNVHYPAEARRAGKQGTVFVAFVVDVDGSIKEPFIVKGISEELDSESLRVVGLFPPWKPARLNETEVASKYVLPIKFKLAGEGKPQKLRRSDWH